MAGVAFAVEGDGVGFATESYAASALYTTLASLSGALRRIRRARGLLPILGLFSASGAFAADLDLTEAKGIAYTAMTPTWSVVGSLSPTYTDNALFSRDDRRRDVFYEPDVSARLDGNLSPDLSYRLYARAQFESFATE